MSFRSRVYRTTKLKNGETVVSSLKTSHWAIWQIIKFCGKAILYLMFFWIIIPVKLLKRKK